MNKEEQATLRGGDRYHIKELVFTRKAELQFNELMPNHKMSEYVCELIGSQVYVFADDSPYRILKDDLNQLRLVFVSMNQGTPLKGKFVLVTVQELYNPNKRFTR